MLRSSDHCLCATGDLRWALKVFRATQAVDATAAEHCFNREEGYTFGASRSSFTAMQIPNQREYHQSRESLDRKLEKGGKQEELGGRCLCLAYRKNCHVHFGNRQKVSHQLGSLEGPNLL